jgi:hypothetical protein
MQLEIPITFDAFGWSAVEERAKVERLGLGGLVARACTHFASELDGDRTATTAPDFSPPPSGRQTRRLTIELGDEYVRRLEREAERQGATLERLLGHATLLYLADIEAGSTSSGSDVRRTGP